MSKKSLIDAIEVKTPCAENWNEMRGNEKIRFCAHCNFEVNNISALTRKQAMRLVRASSGRICVRYVKNPVTRKPVFADKFYQITSRAGLAAGVLGASLSLSTLTYGQGEDGDKIPSFATTETSAEKPSNDQKTEGKTAAVSGTITDPNGAVVPNVPVTLTSLTDNQSRTVTSNDEGVYIFEYVAPGYYKLRAEGVAGFDSKEIASVTVSEGSNVSDISLDVNMETSVVGGMMIADYENALARAVSGDDIEEVKNLIGKGENVNGKDDNYGGITPIFIAVENGSEDTAQTLLSFGAKVNARDANRQTPLMRLDEDASAELVRTLIKYGAKINLTDAQGNTALILAAHSAKAEVLQTLLDHGAQVNRQNKQGQTALMNAAEADHLESVRALIMAGADVNLKNKEGQTAWDLTTSDEIETLLESHGAIVETQ